MVILAPIGGLTSIIIQAKTYEVFFTIQVQKQEYSDDDAKWLNLDRSMFGRGASGKIYTGLVCFGLKIIWV